MLERRMNPDVMTLEKQVTEFVKTHRVEANNTGAVCGDGRATPEQSKGYIRALGGDEGFEAAIIGAQNVALSQGRVKITITPEEIDRRYSLGVKKIRGEEAEAGVHTDSEHEVGCGFMRLAMQGLHEHLSSEETEKLHRAALARIEAKGGKVLVLSGGHEEKALLYVYSEKYSLNSRDGEMYFVVDIARAYKFIEQIAPLMEIKGLAAKDVWKEFRSQMMKTAEQLAVGKELEIFEVHFDDNKDSEENFTTIYKGPVPSPTHIVH